MKRLAALAAVAGVFCVGIVVGALGLWLLAGGRHASFGRPPMHPFGANVIRHLDLDRDQVERIEAVLDEHRARMEDLRTRMMPRVRGMLRQTEHEIEAILTPDQRRRFQELRRRQDRWRGRFRHEPPPPDDLAPPAEPPPTADG